MALRASLLQRQIKLNCDVLTGLLEQMVEVKQWRAMYNVELDKLVDDSSEGSDERRAWYVNEIEQASKFIRKSRAKIAGLEQVQKALKKQLRCEQAIEAWQVREDAEWLQLAQLAQQDNYRVTYSYDRLAEMFKEIE